MPLIVWGNALVADLFGGWLKWKGPNNDNYNRGGRVGLLVAKGESKKRLWVWGFYFALLRQGHVTNKAVLSCLRFMGRQREQGDCNVPLLGRRCAVVLEVCFSIPQGAQSVAHLTVPLLLFLPSS